jgi:hypothetical protein
VTRHCRDALPLLAAGSQTGSILPATSQVLAPCTITFRDRERSGLRSSVNSRTLFVKQPETDRIAEGQNQKVLPADEWRARWRD